ncbi:HK97 gp10 family phage protein [Halococcus hamelinensis]|uniref:Phage protein, HK97 gp10 family n=1 Tax=Halococcus hamelinensis 100A6 TaxID=1132509 RepID=M0LYG0_9EURY|nr:HK97 gp10 family phage protein [Halococcus hamelinensis]EMA38471.1 hypothetical protein C447_09962 [Halococcus hamelinensis 100A6]
MVKTEFKWKHNRNMKDAAKRLNDLQDEVGTSLKSACEEIGLRVIATAVRLVHVDTGRLRASLESQVEEVGKYAVKVSMGTNVPYGANQERLYPYLRPAIRENEQQIERIVNDALQEAVKRAS